MYCEAVDHTKRRPTREVLIGNIGVGSHNPIRIQSMTTSNTRDVVATVNQIIKLADAGCEIARVTVQGIKEAEACEQIKNSLIQQGYNIPLVADIHFYPPAAMRVVDFVDKVRINPGNFVDKRASFKIIDYDDTSYAAELKKIEEKFTPLVEKCKRLKRAMRIGTNHGSLSDRIMNRYGDTPHGMVESALEFARICRKNDYHELIFSMKASNPQVMILAYRLLTQEMYRLGWDYPLHLGVTEAGQGEDGRIKSAMGIGALLLDGIGDTIRVSLTEDAWYEIDPCQRLIRFAECYAAQRSGPEFKEAFRTVEISQRRVVSFPKGIGLHRDGSVILEAKESTLKASDCYSQLGCELRQDGSPKITVSSCDSIVVKAASCEMKIENNLKSLLQAGVGVFCEGHCDIDGIIPVLTLTEAQQASHLQKRTARFALQIAPTQPHNIAIRICDEEIAEWDLLEHLRPTLIFFAPTTDKVHAARRFFDWLQQRQWDVPVILNFYYDCSEEDLIIHAAAECGSLLCDGLGDGVFLQGNYDTSFLRQLSFGILQAARMRMSKTDFISCPSCGRTLFDLQEVTKRIKAQTAHLPGVKIAIMGCVVNGPGEMADADFGYVGSKPGMIDLYVGKECVERDISFADADQRLIELIKRHGRWMDQG